MFILLGALLSRLHGSELFPYKIVKSLMWAAPFMVVSGWYVGWWALLVWGACALGKSTGHGQYYSLATWKESISPERVDFIVSWFFGDDPRCFDTTPLGIGYRIDNYNYHRPNRLYWRCVFGLSVKGFTSTLGFTIAMLFVNPIYALISVIGGAAMPLGYMIHKGQENETGEWISGGLAAIVLQIMFYLGHTVL